MKIYSISPTTNNRTMNTNYNRISPVSFKANSDETSDTVNFQKNLEIKGSNGGILDRAANYLKKAFSPDNNQSVYSDDALYDLMLLAGSKL